MIARFCTRIAKRIALVLLTLLLPFGAMAQEAESAFQYLRDEASLLNADEQKTLEEKLTDYRNRSNHAIYVHISDRSYDKEEARKVAEANFRTYQTRAGKVNSTTLIYVDVYRYSGGEDFSTTALFFYDWDELANNAFDANDHYYSHVPKGNNLISYRFELKVLFHYFNDEDYFGGFERTVDLIEQVHLGKIKSTAIEPTFFASTLGTLVFYFLMVFGGMFLIIIGRKLGLKGSSKSSSKPQNKGQ